MYVRAKKAMGERNSGRDPAGHTRIGAHTEIPVEILSSGLNHCSNIAQ
jgi:hypothetical protein